MILFVVESPNKAKKIRSYFPDFNVIATVGHLRDLPIGVMGVEPPDHKPQYVTVKGKEVIERKLRAAAVNAERIYLATDPDREGEAIASHVYQCIGAKYKDRMARIAYVEVSKKAIEDAMTNARPVNWSLVAAQEARRVIDRYVGYMVSPVLTGLLQMQSTTRAIKFLSAGRVQTIALKLIVERQAEIEQFVPIEHYGVTLALEKSGWDFPAAWLPFFQPQDANLDSDPPMIDPDEEDVNPVRLMTDKSLAALVHERTRAVTVESVTTKGVNIPPQTPLITTTFVQLMAAVLKLPTKKAMEAAQKLFEQGLITYHRTDSPAMSPDFVRELRQFAAIQNLPLPQNPRTYRAKESAQEGHECLRVTDIGQPTVKLADPTQEMVYHLVWLRTLQSQMADAVDDRTLVFFINGHKDRFASRGSIERSPGWRKAEAWSVSIHKANEDSTTGRKALPPMNIGDPIKMTDSTLDLKKTRPPAVYSEKTLVRKLDQLGIGRPSTYAQVIDRILEQTYIARDAKLRLKPTLLGKCVIAAMDQQFAFMEYEYTAELEEYFDEVASRKLGYRELVEAVFYSIEMDLQRFEEKELVAQAAELLRRIDKLATLAKAKKKSSAATSDKTSSKGGGRRSVKETLECSGDKEKIASKKVSRETKNSQYLYAGDACPDCRVGIVRQDAFKEGKKSGKPFMGCTRFPSCRFFKWVH